MLVGLDDGRVNHEVFTVRILRQNFEDALPDIGSAPTRVAQMHHLKVAMALGKSRQGMPAGYRYSTAPTNNLVSRAVMPT